MSIISIDNFGLMLVDYDAGSPLPNESHILQSPDANKWTVLANGTTGIITVTDGASGEPEIYTLNSPNGIEWGITVDDNGILLATSFEGTIMFAPVVNSQIILNGLPAYEEFRLFAFVGGSNPPIAATVYKNGSFVDIQPIPIILNDYGFPTDPVHIKVGVRYDFKLYEPEGWTDGEPEPVMTWDNVSGGAPIDINDPTEFVEPPIVASFSSSPDTFTLQGDRRLTFRSGRRVRFIGGSVFRYGTIFSSVYDGTNTIVVALLDSGSLDTSFENVTYALLSPSTPAIPSRKMIGLKTVLQGPLTIAAKDGLNLLPVSTVVLKKTPAPTGWLECNGAAVSRTTYANLYAAIGTTFGVGDGSSTFNLPNLTPPASLLYIIFAQA